MTALLTIYNSAELIYYLAQVINLQEIMRLI